MSLHYPVLGLGPLHIEWSAAAYERMQARRDALAPGADTWDDPYVKAAHAVERAALEKLHAARLGGPRPLTYKQRMLL